MGNSTDNIRQGNRLVFVGGTPRSGTTLIHNMLDSHPDIFGGPEFHHLIDIIELRRKMYVNIKREWISLICSYDDVDLRIREMIEGFLLSCADKHKCKLFSEKTPNNDLVFSELAELFPQAKCIHIIRDPRAIVSSLLQAAERAKKKKVAVAPWAKSISEAIEFTDKCIDAGFQAETKYPDRIMTIEYEELVKSPEDVTKRICQFLSISWDPLMCSPGELKHAGEQPMTVKSNEIWYDKDTYCSNPNTQSLDKWKSTLTPSQQYTISNAFCNNQNLIRLGYDFSTNELNLKDKMIGLFFVNITRLRNIFLRIMKRASRNFSHCCHLGRNAY